MTPGGTPASTWCRRIQVRTVSEEPMPSLCATVASDVVGLGPSIERPSKPRKRY